MEGLNTTGLISSGESHPCHIKADRTNKPLRQIMFIFPRRKKYPVQIHSSNPFASTSVLIEFSSSSAANPFNHSCSSFPLIQLERHPEKTNQVGFGGCPTWPIYLHTPQLAGMVQAQVNRQRIVTKTAAVE